MQAVLVTCNDEKGNTNVITIAWHTPISKSPPFYGISLAPSRYSHGLIKKTKEFVINFAPYKIVDKVNFCGTNSGRNTEKIIEAKINLESAQKLNTKIIKECYAHLECKLHDTLTLGDHTIFIGEVVNIMSDKNAFKDDLLDNKKIKPTYYVGGNVYTTISGNKQYF
jgi:flavin reductase (DIM6/NTAB) family NADH-FMN oxidoreductase RutF